MSRTIVVLAGATLLAAAVPAQATGYLQGIAGAACSTDHRTYGTWEYREQRLLNTDPDQWGIVVATCPVSLFALGLEPKEYRIRLTDPERRETWCHVYSSGGVLVDTHYPVATDYSELGGITALLTGTLEDSLLAWKAGGMVEMTVHCLLLNKASIDRIEVLWWKP